VTFPLFIRVCPFAGSVPEQSGGKREFANPGGSCYWSLVNWNTVDPEPLFQAIRARGPASDAERSVWAFERALVAARIDGEMLRHLLVACVCLVAHEEGETPRTVLERLFRRAVSDDEWLEEYAPLFT
jgi:hypothetical protein